MTTLPAFHPDPSVEKVLEDFEFQLEMKAMDPVQEDTDREACASASDLAGMPARPFELWRSSLHRMRHARVCLGTGMADEFAQQDRRSLRTLPHTLRSGPSSDRPFTETWLGPNGSSASA
jgi:hypothetical protein